MTSHVHCPKTKEELVALIARETETSGFGCSLDHIDVSQITDMNSLFGYEELTSLDAANEWLAAQPLCRYHWDVLLYEHGRPSRSDAPWRQPEHMEHLQALLPTLQGFGMSPLEMAEQLHARWQMRGWEHTTLPLPTLE